MSELKRVQTGERIQIPARTWNAFIDAAEAHRRVNTDSRRGRPFAVNETLILVKNETGADLPRWGCMGLFGPIYTPTENESEFANHAAMRGAAITTSDHYAGRFVVSIAPIASEKIGVCVLRGVTTAMINVVDEEHGHADTYPGEDFLRSGWTGAARILWKEPGTGEKMAMIDIGPADLDRFSARIMDAYPIPEAVFGWTYEWELVQLDADINSDEYGQWTRPTVIPTPPPGTSPVWLSSDGDETRRAFNRHESHLLIQYEQDPGEHGYFVPGACNLPDTVAPPECPPPRAAVMMLQPILRDAVVEMRAERTRDGDTRFTFQALNGTRFEGMVPGGGV